METMNKEISIKINKTNLGYTVSDYSNSRISYFTDDDQGRQMFIQYLVEELFNKEVTHGTKYVREN